MSFFPMTAQNGIYVPLQSCECADKFKPQLENLTAPL